MRLRLEGQKIMSALPPKADIRERGVDVRFVPIADMSLQPVSSKPRLRHGRLLAV